MGGMAETLTVAGARDDAGFAALVRQHQAMVFSIAYHFFMDRDAAEELSQDVFLKLHRNLPGLKSPEHVTSWLRKVTSHRCIDLARRRKVCAFLGLDQVAEPAAPVPECDPLRSEFLKRLVASLPEQARLLIILRYEEEMPVEEIAATLGIKSGTVKSQLNRTLAVLREKAGRAMGEKAV
jgi:RNA polymerase sigma-70 factor, ECF subfamily